MTKFSDETLGIGGDYLQEGLEHKIHGEILQICSIWLEDLRGGERGNAAAMAPVGSVLNEKVWARVRRAVC